MSQFVLFAAGSRGDLQPLVALGQGLAARGHRVRVIASTRYEELIAAAGLEPARLSADPTEMLRTDAGQELLAGGRNPVRLLRGFRRLVGPMAEELLAEVLAAAKDADLFVCPTVGLLGRHLADSLGIPWAVVHFQPSEPTGAFAHPMVPQAGPLGRWGRRASYHAVEQIGWQLTRPFVNRWRQDVLGLAGLPPRGPMRAARRDGVPVLCCFSPAVVPRPPDWPDNVTMTGYWFVADKGYQPPPELDAFLQAGPPPVYVGFGSMVPPDPAATYRLARTALRRAGVRGVLQGDPAPAEDDMFVVDDVPHSWLFPRTAAVVHHGGAGTTAAALRAGVPAVVCPFFGDQPYWAERVTALRAGPDPLPFKKLTADRLAHAVRTAVNDPALRTSAAALADRLSAEDGVSQACTLLEARLR